MDQSTLVNFKAKGVDFLRTNMCHSSLEDLERAIALSRQIGIPFMIDTEGPQVRTGNLKAKVVHLRENSTVEVWSKAIDGDQRAISLRPTPIVGQLEEGDLLHIDFDSLILRVCDTSTVDDGFIRARSVTTGTIGRNKAVVVDPVMERKLDLPALSEKDLKAIAIGLREGIEHVALSFVRSALDIDEIRRITENRMKVIAKVECREALRNLDEIIEAADFLLIDRGDLGKEVPIERIPFIQRIIISRAKEKNVGVFVATNLLESMVERRRPTRSEAHDVVDTVLDGASGLTLAAETAMGRYPTECVNMMDRLIRHAEEVARLDLGGNSEQARAVRSLDGSDYILGAGESSGLIRPHGGRLVTRVVSPPDDDWLQSLPTVSVRDEQRREVEQIANGTYSPLEGFMGERDFRSVLNTMRLSNGTVWPIPIVLDVSPRIADDLSVGQDVALASDGERFAVLHLEEMFPFPRREAILGLYGTTYRAHSGASRMLRMEPVLLGGKIDLIRRRPSATRQYELSPRQVRHLFDEKGWNTVLGFQHNGALPTTEIMKVERLADDGYDGFFVHPVIEGELKAELIVKRWEATARRHLPSKKLVFAVRPALPRHGCARDALFTALCRKNFGCSHFIAAEDNARVNGYTLGAVERLFGQFDDLGITLLMRDEFATRVSA